MCSKTRVYGRYRPFGRGTNMFPSTTVRRVAIIMMIAINLVVLTMTWHSFLNSITAACMSGYKQTFETERTNQARSLRFQTLQNHFNALKHVNIALQRKGQSSVSYFQLNRNETGFETKNDISIRQLPSREVQKQYENKPGDKSAERLRTYEKSDTHADEMFKPNYKHLSYFPNSERHNFPLTSQTDAYIINNSTICKSAKTLTFLIIVHSATENFVQRENIRRTWGNTSFFMNHDFRIVFMLGTSRKEPDNARIKYESSVNNDIVQGAFLDTYQNLTNKVVLGMRWISENCMNTKMVLKVDDDVFVNMQQLLNYVNSQYSTRSREVYCMKRDVGTSIIQRGSGKWMVNQEYFKDKTYYPFDHCNGFFVMISPDIIRSMYETSKVTPFLWLDDVYMFGLIPDIISGIKINTVQTMLETIGNTGMECFKSEKKRCDLWAVIMQDYDAFEKLWKYSLINHQIPSQP